MEGGLRKGQRFGLVICLVDADKTEQRSEKTLLKIRVR